MLNLGVLYNFEFMIIFMLLMVNEDLVIGVFTTTRRVFGFDGVSVVVCFFCDSVLYSGNVMILFGSFFCRFCIM